MARLRLAGRLRSQPPLGKETPLQGASNLSRWSGAQAKAELPRPPPPSPTPLCLGCWPTDRSSSTSRPTPARTPPARFDMAAVWGNRTGQQTPNSASCLVSCKPGRATTTTWVSRLTGRAARAQQCPRRSSRVAKSHQFTGRQRSDLIPTQVKYLDGQVRVGTKMSSALVPFSHRSGAVLDVVPRSRASRRRRRAGQPGSTVNRHNGCCRSVAALCPGLQDGWGSQRWDDPPPPSAERPRDERF